MIEIIQLEGREHVQQLQKDFLTSRAEKSNKYYAGLLAHQEYMKNNPVYPNELAEKAFRTWQERHCARLRTHAEKLQKVMDDKDFDYYSLQVYTGRIKVDLDLKKELTAQ